MAQSITLAVNGMTCASCVARAERVLRAQTGVQAASVNLALQNAHVVFDDPATDEALAQALTRAGYAATTAPQTVSTPKHDSRPIWRKALFAMALTLPVFAVEMGGHLWPALHHLRQDYMNDLALAYVEMALIGAVLAGPGRGFFTKGLPALVRGAPDMNALVAVGAGAAYLFSAFVTVSGAGGTIFFETAGVAVTLILFGRALEMRAKGAAGEAIARLVALQPLTALRVQGDQTAEVPIAGLVVGDLIRIRAGERIAADGIVVNGQSSIDTAMLTGEAMPMAVGVGDAVAGGCVNGAGSLTLRVTATGAGSVLARITQMVGAAQAVKLPVQDLVDRVALWFVPIVMAASAATFAIWWGVGQGVAAALIHAVAVLIIACPCAMGLAVPVSILVGTGRGAQLGVLFRGGAALQRLANVDVIGFDKTGTLTVGAPQVVDHLGDDAALALAAGVEAQSTHPLAHAILGFARARGISPAQITDMQVLAGRGAIGQAAGGAVQVGSAALMGDLAQPWADFAARAGLQGRGVIFVAQDGKVIGAYAVEDALKPGAAQHIDALRDLGLRLVMLTGDSSSVAQRVANVLKIVEVQAHLLPENKASAVAALGPNSAFVGDGINDAPALAQASVGIAMGTGTDVAIEAGDVVLMKGDLAAVARAILLSRAVMRNIRQNLFWAFVYNVALIPVAMGALVPFGGPSLSPMLGALAMAASSIFVIGNALRLRRFFAL